MRISVVQTVDALEKRIAAIGCACVRTRSLTVPRANGRGRGRTYFVATINRGESRRGFKAPAQRRKPQDPLWRISATRSAFEIGKKCYLEPFPFSRDTSYGEFKVEEKNNLKPFRHFPSSTIIITLDSRIREDTEARKII